MLPNNVKLVIWDLDDTFWSGTLAEGEITPIEANQTILTTLAERGIISSICSKNNHSHAMQRLQQLGLAQYFVFPKIEFGPKGQNIAAIIETAGLRAENVLFVDDNRLNLEEARHVSPGLMTAEPDILPTLLDLPQTAGKDDHNLTRLSQYKNLEVKAVERGASTLSNEDFLRACGIRVHIDYDIEKNFDRILELANRTNQLNFTKIRLETPKAVAEFRNLCNTYGTSVGVVNVADRYGDYGAVGFFLLRKVFDTRAPEKLVHFVFSCRTMNMGIEQYVYERLREPPCHIVQPVANPIKSFEKIDWIKEAADGDVQLGALEGDKKLVLIGGCELRQLASLCSTNRAEYVNEVDNGLWVQHNDMGFILSDRKVLAEDEMFPKLGVWKASRAVEFDRDLESSAILVASMYQGLGLDYFRTARQSWAGLTPWMLNRQLKQLQGKFARNFWFIPVKFDEKLKLMEQCFDRIGAIASPTAHLFTLGVVTNIPPHIEQLQPRGLANRAHFNEFMKDYCKRTGRFTFVDLNSIVRQDELIDSSHFHRKAYLSIAEFISKSIAASKPVETGAKITPEPALVEQTVSDEKKARPPRRAGLSKILTFAKTS